MKSERALKRAETSDLREKIDEGDEPRAWETWPESHEGRECPKSLGSHECPESHECPVSPVSEGQGLEIEAGALVVLKRKAERNACTERNTARKRCWQLLRDLKAVEKGAGRELTIDELMVAFDEWHSLSASFLDPAKTRDYYLAKFFAQLAKVRVPTGEGDTLNKALEAVSKLTDSELPEIPGLRDTPESFRRVAALHREMSRLSGSKTYFLSCRDSAKAFPGLIYQQAYSINLGLVELDVIKIVCPGEHREGGKATEFRYLLPEDGNGEVE